MWIGCHHRSPENPSRRMWVNCVKESVVAEDERSVEKDVKRRKNTRMLCKACSFVTMTLHQHNESAEWVFMLLAHHWAFHMAQQCQEFPFRCELQILEWSAIEWFSDVMGKRAMSEALQSLNVKIFLFNFVFLSPRAHNNLVLQRNWISFLIEARSRKRIYPSAVPQHRTKRAFYKLKT